MTNKDCEERVMNLLRSYQCSDCRDGKVGCHHTREEARASIENTETGEVRYFCCMACALLNLSEGDRNHAIESQFNRDGHYEQLASAWYDRNKLPKR